MGSLTEHHLAMRAGVGRIAEHVPELPLTDVILARLIMMSGAGVAEALERELRPLGLNEPEFRTLAVIFSSPDGHAFPSEVCQLATQKPTNMTRIIDGLVRRDLVTRTPSAEDRRRIIIQLTPEGRRLTRKTLPKLFANAERLFTGFTAKERQQFDALLQKLIDNLDAITPDQDLRA